MIPYLVPAGRLDEAPAMRPYPEALAVYAVGMAGHLPIYKAAGGKTIVASAFARMTEADQVRCTAAFRAEFKRRHDRYPELAEFPFPVCSN